MFRRELWHQISMFEDTRDQRALINILYVPGEILPSKVFLYEQNKMEIKNI